MQLLEIVDRFKTIKKAPHMQIAYAGTFIHTFKRGTTRLEGKLKIPSTRKAS